MLPVDEDTTSDEDGENSEECFYLAFWRDVTISYADHGYGDEVISDDVLLIPDVCFEGGLLKPIVVRVQSEKSKPDISEDVGDKKDGEEYFHESDEIQ